MTPDSSNLFTLLTLIVAPAALTNASSVLALNTANRIGRVVDRSRQLVDQMVKDPHNAESNAMRGRQIDRLRRRARLLLRAQTRFYVALGLFVASALLCVVGAALASSYPTGYRVVGVVGFGAGSAAAISLVWGAMLVVQETRIALEALTEEGAMLEALLQPPPPGKPAANGPTTTI